MYIVMMANKQLIKLSEARILIFLENADLKNCFTLGMATKLRMDYGYIIKILLILENKEWIRSNKVHGKRFYELTKKAPLEIAKQIICEAK